MDYRLRMHLTQEDLVELLGEPMAPELLVPELIAIAHDPGAARELPGTALVQGVLAPYLADIEHMPATTYTLYREFRRTGERRTYQEPHHEKRAKLCAAAFEVLLGDDSCLDLLQEHIWAVCEGTNWVLPAHENREVALRSVGTGFSLAEISVGLRDKLADEVVDRIGAEIERRIFEPYLECHDRLSWWKGGNNWNGVCNSGVGAMFLLLEEVFVTWCETVVAGSTARIVGERHILDLQIEEPADAFFALEVLEEAARANAKSVPLKRLTYTGSGLETELVGRVRIQVRAR